MERREKREIRDNRESAGLKKRRRKPRLRCSFFVVLSTTLLSFGFLHALEIYSQHILCGLLLPSALRER